MTERLQQLEDPHTEFVLQRSCYSLPKFSFILRTVDTTGMMPLLRRFDTVTRDGLARILGTTLDDRAWHQAKLPVSKGGMGMRAAEDHAPVAYAAQTVSAPAVRDAVLTTIKLNPGHAVAYRVD